MTLDYVPSWINGAKTLLQKVNRCIEVTEENIHVVKEGVVRAGEGIEINGGVISDKPYTAGEGIEIENRVISDKPYTAGEGIEIENRVISDKPYTAGEGIEIENRVISLALDKIYPVGSVYISIMNTNPSALFGGIWQQITDKFLLAASDIYSINPTYSGGAENGNTTHTHTLNNGYAEITLGWDGTENHFYEKTKSVSVTYDKKQSTSGFSQGAFSFIEATALGGSTDVASSMPPYLVVYMWKRVS